MSKQTSPSTRQISLVVGIVFILWLVLDQASKWWILQHYGQGEFTDAGWLHIHLVWNPGAAFSIPMPTPVIQGAVALLALILIVRAIPRVSSWIVAISFGAILGGAVGNLADRFIHDGKVVDFIDLAFWPLQSFPVFNIADIGISVGTGIVLVALAIHDWKASKANAEEVAYEPLHDDTDQVLPR